MAYSTWNNANVSTPTQSSRRLAMVHVLDGTLVRCQRTDPGTRDGKFMLEVSPAIEQQHFEAEDCKRQGCPGRSVQQEPPARPLVDEQREDDRRHADERGDPEIELNQAEGERAKPDLPIQLRGQHKPEEQREHPDPRGVERPGQKAGVIEHDRERYHKQRRLPEQSPEQRGCEGGPQQTDDQGLPRKVAQPRAEKQVVEQSRGAGKLGVRRAAVRALPVDRPRCHRDGRARVHDRRAPGLQAGDE